MRLSIQQPDEKKLINNKTKHFTCEFKHSAARREKASQQQNKTRFFTCEFKHSAARREKASQQQNKTNQNKTKQNILHVSLSIQRPDEKKILNNKTKQNKPKQNKTKQNKTKQNKTKQNKKHFTCEFKHSAARWEKASQQQN